MNRRTKYIVYVDKVIMDKPAELFDAAFSHLIKKDEENRKKGKRSGADIVKRKQFMAKFMKAYTPELQLRVIDEWVQVRDIATFPYRSAVETEGDTITETLISEPGIEVCKEQNPRESTTNIVTDAGMALIDDALNSGEEQDEDSEAEGGISMDDRTDGEPEQDTTPE